MPIYFLLSIWVLLSVGSEPTPQAYFERGALFYNALTAGKPVPLEMASSCEERHSPDARTAGRTRPEGRAGACGGQLSQSLRGGLRFWLTARLFTTAGGRGADKGAEKKVPAQAPG